MRRDEAESDLELARTAVAELAAAACVVDAGLDWAVAVGRNAGVPTLWVATNDGASYIPPGVYVRKTMPIAAGFDGGFDARWLGWVNPAEKAVRAARARGDVVGAVATTWAWPSEYLADPGSGVREVAIGVPHGGPDSPAAELLPSRSHRLQTVDAALYADLKAAPESAVDDYCRELTRRVAFGSGDELSPLAQSVAGALVARRWPKPEEWAALGAEYDSARLLMGAQRPGLDGVEDPDQLRTYTKLFVNCRRLETLVCWQRSGAVLADVVYAAWVAGVRMAMLEYSS
ncbi:chemotaxis protein [Mycobacterium simiae]|uniref:Chemotaxis protein n=1 Tax=Mycobacterium simiae TaxID=1784 RepID=A0A5B1BI28_MYCSI|nr:chemotaxis protein [Mycobacterium simiae]